MKHHEQARLLLKKASDDEALPDEVLDSNRVTDEIIGFHCQQAVEKLLKAVLSESKIQYRRTHDLTELMDLLVENGINVPHCSKKHRYLLIAFREKQNKTVGEAKA